MFGATILLLAAAQVTLVVGAPSSFQARSLNVAAPERRQNLGIHPIRVRKDKKTGATVTVTVTAAAAAATGGATAGAEEEEEEEEKTRTTGVLGTAVALKGGNELQAVSFKGTAGVGSMEIEYQNIDGRTLTVTENKTPGAAPLGFKLVDSSSYVVALAEGSSNITRQQIDYVFDLTNAAVKAQNLSAVQTGKLCTETNAFVISSAIGEQDFEADEGESVLKTNNIVGEWGLFLPVV